MRSRINCDLQGNVDGITHLCGCYRLFLTTKNGEGSREYRLMYVRLLLKRIISRTCAWLVVVCGLNCWRISYVVQSTVHVVGLRQDWQRLTIPIQTQQFWWNYQTQQMMQVSVEDFWAHVLHLFSFGRCEDFSAHILHLVDPRQETSTCNVQYN